MTIKLRTKLTVAFLFVSIIPLIALWASSLFTRETLTDSAQQTLFAVTSENAAKIDGLIQANLNQINTVAQLPQLVQYLQLPLRERKNFKQISSLLTGLRDYDPAIITQLIFDRDGQMTTIAYDLTHHDIGINVSNKPFFQKPVRTGRPYVSNVKFLLNGKAVIYLCSPIKNKNRTVVGVFLRVYDVSELQNKLIQKDDLLPTNSFVTLIDEHQRFLAHSDRPDLVYKFVTAPDKQKIKYLRDNQGVTTEFSQPLFSAMPQLAFALKQQLSQTTITLNGQLHQVTIKKLDTLPWSVILFQPQAVFLRPILELEKYFLGLGVLIVLLTIVIATTLAQLLTEPITRLTDMAKQVAIGNLEVKAKIRSRDEIGILAMTFNRMTRQLRGLIGRLEHRVAELTETQHALNESANRLQQYSDELEEKNEQLELMDKLKDEFLANTSHELRTPLNGIIGLSESMLDGAVGDISTAQAKNLSLIVSSGRRLAALVNDILDFSKLKHEALLLQAKPMYLWSLSKMVLALSYPLVQDKPVELNNSISPDTPPVQADENRVQQILYNLVGNAIKFTRAGTVELSAKVEETHVAITVTDTGIGIPFDKQDRVFEAFQQADGSITRRYGGTGIGLAVTRKLVELHGGEIRLQSAPGEGAAFTFTLPIADTLPEKRQSDVNMTTLVSPLMAREETSEFALAPSGDTHILVVDDEPINRQVLANHLRLKNYRVTLAVDGVEALALLQDANYQFDLVVLDVMMPKLSGYEVCQEIRKQYPITQLPVIMLTAKNQLADLVIGLEVGANDYLIKPFSKLELLARIKTHLQIISLSNLNVQKDKFFSIVAHDLRGPFMPLLGTSELLAEMADFLKPHEIKEMGQSLHRSATNVYSLLENLLQWARMQMGRMEYQPELVNVTEILTNNIELMSEHAKSKEIVLSMQANENLQVYVDRNMLDTVVRNLTTNAIKFTTTGGTITLSAATYEESATTLSEFVELSVADTGVGISNDDIDKLFQIDTNHTTVGTAEEKGTGLGLVMCKEMVEMNKGRIWVESQLGQGTAVKFIVPSYQPEN